jgi:hypothetical protein
VLLVASGVTVVVASLVELLSLLSSKGPLLLLLVVVVFELLLIRLALALLSSAVVLDAELSPRLAESLLLESPLSEAESPSSGRVMSITSQASTVFMGRLALPSAGRAAVHHPGNQPIVGHLDGRRLDGRRNGKIGPNPAASASRQRWWRHAAHPKRLTRAPDAGIVRSFLNDES